ncbi:hypothetical protein ISF_05777 [Cordyceps fumosorosea ARSEF 2679]|uniref:Uncharacterized protein n=1 Tax=Cordyceps fumosorosea (strain ARSEF 2679) TaxID=1081104 RepID=A0A167TM33_CORFA|nr:hypothetical protein ISF_05777 [Cordyceps fumosorosea ARSEF 2679]OAA60738.1 hypothetical protein ISF_05777 [Cordyceps fumosorosea ARSEF 2679]
MDSEDGHSSRQQTPNFDSSAAESVSDPLDDLQQAETNRNKRRIATVYDAVAGRLSSRSTLATGESSKSTLTAKYSLRETKYRPDEVLFRRKDAPQRYAEHDIYYAHERDLPRAGRGVLPESDLLKAVHDYSGRFYKSMRRRSSATSLNYNVDEASMDETALLAFGILLEEAGREILGKRGDMVFTEGVEPEEDKDKEPLQLRNRHTIDDTVGPLEGFPRDSQAERASKRRRVGSKKRPKS